MQANRWWIGGFSGCAHTGVSLLLAGAVLSGCGDDTQSVSAGGTVGASQGGGTANSATTGQGDGSRGASSGGPSTASTSAAQTTASQTTSPDTQTGSSGGSSGTTGGGQRLDPPVGVVRFIALGDGGEGNDNQYAVADVVEQVCADRGCEFAVYLGDNIYDTGVDSPMDVQFTDKFELPYADLDLPFYISLGNHDYDLLGNAWWKGEYQVEYSQYSDKWTMPDVYYEFAAAHVTFISLDTARLFWDYEIGAQRQFVQGVLAETTSPFTVAFGHHPYISNGQHGNAGNYEGTSFIPIVNGADVKDFFDAEICGKVTVYISGHDHTRQWFPTTCGTEFIVSGAAAKTTDMQHRDDNPVPYFEEDTNAGFAWIEIQDTEMTVAWYDLTGAMNYENTITLQQ